MARLPGKLDWCILKNVNRTVVTGLVLLHVAAGQNAIARRRGHSQVRLKPVNGVAAYRETSELDIEGNCSPDGGRQI